MSKGNRSTNRGRGPEPRPLAEIHGLRSTFVNRKCDCPDCREANAKYKRDWYHGRKWAQ